MPKYVTIGYGNEAATRVLRHRFALPPTLTTMSSFAAVP